MLNFVHRNRRVLAALTVLVLAVVALFYIPVPYYITQPGSAIELQPIIEVHDGFKKEKGTFMLVTVSMLNGNAALYLYACVSPYADLLEYNRLLGNDETPEEYHERQLYVMQYSQDNAVLAAYSEAADNADVTAQAQNNGVRVIRTVQGMPAEKVLKPGDVIRKVDGEEVHTAEQLLRLLKKKQPEETVTLSLLRKGERRQIEVALDRLPPSHDNPEQENRVGLGVYPVTNRVVKASPQVTIDTNEIGGPSAGLMMSLEIYNQLTKGDLTKGYRIAGTGTITPEGKVGQIGSADHKVVAADAQGADIFFVPADVNPQDDNESVALATARDLGTDMEVVPVATLADAINYLEELPHAPREGK